MKRRNMTLSVILLIAADQIIKLLIYFFCMDRRFKLTSWLGLQPQINTDQMSVLNNELNLNVSHSILIIIAIAMLICLFLFFIHLKKEFSGNQRTVKLLTVCFALTMAGTICYLIDLIFWGGSLDYVLLFTQVIDLKDVYQFAGGMSLFGFCMIMAAKEHKSKKSAAQ